MGVFREDHFAGCNVRSGVLGGGGSIHSGALDMDPSAGANKKPRSGALSGSQEILRFRCGSQDGQEGQELRLSMNETSNVLCINVGKKLSKRSSVLLANFLGLMEAIYCTFWSALTPQQSAGENAT